MQFVTITCVCIFNMLHHIPTFIIFNTTVHTHDNSWRCNQGVLISFIGGPRTTIRGAATRMTIRGVAIKSGRLGLIRVHSILV
jgi:hypothetical protein